MDTTSIRLLKSLIEEPKDGRTLMSILGIKERRLEYIIKNLNEQNYLEKENTIVKLKETPKITLFRDISKIVDVEKLLYESNEIVLSSVVDAITVDEIQRNSGLSKTTVYRSISDLQSIGVIIKKDDTVIIDQSKKSLVLFAKILKTEREQKYENGSTEIIYNHNSKILRCVPVGKIAKGATTSFTLFSDFGIEYQTIHDYFCEQDDDMNIQDVLMHAVYSANYLNDKMALLMSIIFYVKHKEKMDIFQLRKKATEFGISEIWIDIEAYVRRKQLKNPDLFLPWDEFQSKASLYDISFEKYTLPKPSSLFEDIGNKLDNPITIYLFGGENMRIKKLKSSTKDCDVVVENNVDFEHIIKILTLDLGYNRIIDIEYSDEDRRLSPDDILVHPARSRIDLFTLKIMQDLSLSSSMKEKADVQEYGKLKIGLLRNEHVFILKAIASREGDIQDMASLVKGSTEEPSDLHHGSFDWDLVWDEILRQEHINHTQDFTTTIFEQISYLGQQTGIIPPFLDKLRRHVLDRLVKMMLRGGGFPTKEIVDFLVGAEITEQMIRNRIDALTKEGIIEKYPIGRSSYVKLLKNNEFAESEWKITPQHLKLYLNWRFHLRRGGTDKTIEIFAEELKEMAFQTIGEIDLLIRNSTSILTQYESEQFSKNYFSSIGAARICIGLHYSKKGKKYTSNFFISEFDKYHTNIKNTFIPSYPQKTVI